MKALLRFGLVMGLPGILHLSETSGPIRFQEMAPGAGLAFTLQNHPTPRKHMIETMAGGLSVFDYDGDGFHDIFFTNGAAIPELTKQHPGDSNRLFRNEGNWKFRDVTRESGLAGEGYSMGAAAADFDNDGHPDLFVAGVFHNRLYRNRGNGTFEDVTDKAGILSGKWSVAAGWFDYDSDGNLDLFVVNYAQWTPAYDRFCGDSERKIRVYCHPKYFEGLPNTLYRNRGDGTFEDVSKAAGLLSQIGRGMSVAFADYDDDGWIDAFVTNDNLPNFLFHNLQGKRFEEVALLAGTAMVDSGKAVASMGADFRDYDNDGRPDITVTALNGETFPLFHNDGKGLFHDSTFSSKLAQPSGSRSGWGNGLVDLDNDGWKDLFTADSHVNDLVEMFEPSQYRQANAVFRNNRDGTFSDVTASAGTDFQTRRAHRGNGFADFDHDGKMDAVVSSLGDRAELWRNVTPGQNHWLIVRLIGSRSNRDGIGAVVSFGQQTNVMSSAVGYASSSLYGVHFGLGPLTRVERLDIRWPSGRSQTLRDVPADQVLEVREPEDVQP